MNKKAVFIMILMVAAFSALLTVVRTSRVVDSWVNRDWFTEYENLVRVDSAHFPAAEKQNESENYLILQDDEEETSIGVADNLEKAIRYMRKKVTRISMTKKVTTLNYEDYSAILIALEDLGRLPDMGALVRYVTDGGGVLLAERPLDNEAFGQLYRKIGIYEKSDLRESNGMTLMTDLLVGGKGVSILDNFVNNSIPVQLERDCVLHAVSLDKIPLVWSRKIEKGHFVIVNGQFLVNKNQRGIIPGILHALSDKPMIFPTLNVAMLHIDDFPAPFPDGENPWIYPVYRMSTADFMRQVWWPDMLALSAKYGFKYTAFIIETYQAKVEGDFLPNQFLYDKGNLIIYGRELFRSGGEMGIHGFNHQPLLLEGQDEAELDYTNWLSVPDMVRSLQGVDSFLQSIYSQYAIHGYVPPSNMLGAAGRGALPAALPSLKVISSLYTGYDSYTQEFERAKDGILEMPRLTSDFIATNEIWWQVLNGVSLHGSFIHFIHPDNILDPDRNHNMTWEQLRSAFDSFLGSVKTGFPWLQQVTLSEGAVALERYLDAQTVFLYADDHIQGAVNGFRDHLWFILRTERKPVNPVGCTITFMDEGVYMIRAEKPDFEIGLEESP